jgi:hypothetical protein
MALTEMWKALIFYFEETFDVGRDKGKVSREKLYEINARVESNVWYDKEGRAWPSSDSL